MQNKYFWTVPVSWWALLSAGLRPSSERSCASNFLPLPLGTAAGLQPNTDSLNRAPKPVVFLFIYPRRSTESRLTAHCGSDRLRSLRAVLGEYGLHGAPNVSEERRRVSTKAHQGGSYVACDVTYVMCSGVCTVDKLAQRRPPPSPLIV